MENGKEKINQYNEKVSDCVVSHLPFLYEIENGFFENIFNCRRSVYEPHFGFDIIKV